eukprot:SAG22_NODE_54_length_23787_cov_12.917511_10_plen_249_part_00
MDVTEEVVAEDGTVMRYDGSGVPEVQPPRFERDDAAGIRESLRVHGFATVKEAMLPHEVEEGRRLLWQFLQGDEAPLMTQTRPVGWKQGSPTTWVEGHGDHLISCTAHCDSMWFCRTRPGVIQGFATAIGTPDLTAAFDRMSINLPTSSGNPVALERAAQSYEHGKFGVMQRMHTHKNGYCECWHVLPAFFCRCSSLVVAVLLLPPFFFGNSADEELPPCLLQTTSSTRPRRASPSTRTTTPSCRSGT